MCSHLIPIPAGWAHLFLDYPSLGVAFWRSTQLMSHAEVSERHLLHPFCERVALACCLLEVVAMKPISALNSKWKRVAYTKSSLSAATAAWEGQRPAVRYPPLPVISHGSPPTLTATLGCQPGKASASARVPPNPTNGGCPPMGHKVHRPQWCLHLSQSQRGWMWQDSSPRFSRHSWKPNWLKPTPTMPTSSHSTLQQPRLLAQKGETRTPSSQLQRGESSKHVRAFHMSTSSKWNWCIVIWRLKEGHRMHWDGFSADNSGPSRSAPTRPISTSPPS
jgi:hypothetical protein